jgi:hypothetical protein
MDPVTKAGSLDEGDKFVSGRILGRIGSKRLTLRARASSQSAPSNLPLQRTGTSVATLPLAPAAERLYRWAA